MVMSFRVIKYIWQSPLMRSDASGKKGFVAAQSMQSLKEIFLR